MHGAGIEVGTRPSNCGIADAVREQYASYTENGMELDSASFVLKLTTESTEMARSKTSNLIPCTIYVSVVRPGSSHISRFKAIGARRT